MSFSETLRTYLEQLDVSSKDFAQAAGMPPSTLSRYLSGERTPTATSEVVHQLASGIAALSNGSLQISDVASELHHELTGSEVDPRTFTRHFSMLMNTLDIQGSHLAHALGFDPSYISRVRTGQRLPNNLAGFSSRVARYVAHNCTDEQHRTRLAKLIGATDHDMIDTEICEQMVRDYLGSGASTDNTDPATVKPLQDFLATLDAFDLNAFLEEIHFNDIKVPTVPFQLPTAKTYEGIEDMKQAELDFLKMAVLSKSTEDVIMFSDMPLEEMAQDKTFTKDVMKGVALLVRKGITIQNIHDVYRPLEELFMGLEGWLPVYMTGHMESHYLPSPTNTAFLHFLRSAGTVAAAGEAVVDNQGSGRYVVTKHPGDVAYYRTRAMQLLSLAKPLLKVFREEDQGEKEATLHKLEKAYGHNTINIDEGEFKTLTITALPGHYVLISKSTPPAVDILVEHPALVEALEHYTPTLF